MRHAVARAARWKINQQTYPRADRHQPGERVLVIDRAEYVNWSRLLVIRVNLHTQEFCGVAGGSRPPATLLRDHYAVVPARAGGVLE